MNPLPSSASFPAPRVRPNALHAFGGVWRLTVRRLLTWSHWLVLAGMIAGLALISGSGHPADGTKHFTEWVGGFYLAFLVPIFSFISAGGLLRDDLKAGAVDYVFTRPIPRPRFVVFRYLAHVGCAQIDFLFPFALLAGVGIAFHVPDFAAALPRLLLAQMLAVAAFSAFGFLCAMLTSRYVVLGLSYGVLIELGIGSLPTQLSRLSMIRQLTNVFRSAVDLRMGMHGPLAVQPLSALTSVVILLGLVAAMVGVAALIFGRREPAGSLGREA